MKAYLPNFLFVVGVCIGIVGGAGFHDPTTTGRNDVVSGKTEALAWPLFGAGIIIIGMGGVMQRNQKLSRKSAAAADGSFTSHSDYVDLLSRIRVAVVELDEKKESLSREELSDRIDALLNGDFFDLVDKREDMLEAMGFANYAAVWEGVATAERQLARVWSIATDGYLAEALLDLPSARQNLDRAVKEMGCIWGPTTST